MRLLAFTLLVAPACTEDVQLSAGWREVGAPCASEGQCPTNLCHVGGPGYCTAACAAEGDTAGCPPDSICKPIQGSVLRCLVVCGRASSCGATGCAADACPSGSNCVAVGMTGVMACEPSPAF